MLRVTLNKRVATCHWSFRHPTFAAPSATRSATVLPQPTLARHTHTVPSRSRAYPSKLIHELNQSSKVCGNEGHHGQSTRETVGTLRRSHNAVFSHRYTYVLWLIHLLSYSQRRRKTPQRRRHRPRRSRQSQVHGHAKSTVATRSLPGKRI